jgi:hypothetical protein
MAKTYFKKLRDPRWQKLRLEIMQRDDFTCQLCESKQKTLHVHHGYYESTCEPWEYNINSLTTLCESCHVEAESIRKNIQMIVGHMPLRQAMEVEGMLITMPGVFKRIYGEEI